MSLTLDAIRGCLEGVIPAVIATSAPGGEPNVAYLSQVHYVDGGHVALSFQFFSKTRENILANPRAVVQVVDPDTAAHYRLTLHYLRTETAGPLFEHMKAKLAGIASHTGMGKVFRLLGADIYRVESIEAVGGGQPSCAQPVRSRLPALRTCSRELAACTDLDGLLEALLAGLEREFEIRHAMVLMADPVRGRLYTVASRGYPASGIGSEIPLGAGIIGVAARECTPIRIMYPAGPYTYSRALRETLLQQEPEADFETEIPFPGLPAPQSQLAVPILLGGAVLGVLYVESGRERRFSYEDEDALATLADHLALALRLLQETTEEPAAPGPAAHSGTDRRGQAVVIRHYPANHSVFIDADYLIKGVAGAIFWRLLTHFTGEHRTEFSNRELRLDPAIGLPDISDNLEARLVLLQKRLREHCDFLRIEKTGRGRFRLRVDRPIRLEESG